MRSVLPILLSKLTFTLAEPTRTIVASEGIERIQFSIVGILKARDGIWMHVRKRESRDRGDGANPQAAATSSTPTGASRL